MPIDVTDETFQTEVLDRSHQVPVVVDLWAPWCGPCLTLGPILEQAVDATEGRVVLAKVDVDENPKVKAQFQVQGIPAVYAVHQGAVVDGFIGAQGPREVQAFIDQLVPSEAEQEIERLVAAGDEASLRQALEVDPGAPAAVTALAELLATDGRGDEALELLARIPETADTRRVAALARSGAAIDGDEDIAARLDALLDQVKGDDEARQAYVDLLELLGADDPRTADYRRRLTAQLY